MVLGVHTFVWDNSFSTDTIKYMEKAAAIGYECFEIAIGSAFDRKQVKDAVRRLGLQVALSCTANASRSIASEDPDIRERGQAFFRDCFEIAEELECSSFAGPLFSTGKAPFPRSEEARARERLIVAEELGRLAREAKKHGVTVSIEPVNRYKSDLINTADQALSLIDLAGESNLGVLFDTYHANIEERDLAQSIKKIGARMGEVHVCDNDKGAPGTGHIDFYAVAEALRRIGYHGKVIFESFLPYDKDNVWRPLAVSQDELALLALQNMRRFFSKRRGGSV